LEYPGGIVGIRSVLHHAVGHDLTTLFAALNVRDGTVLGRCMAQHRHQEFVRFLNAIERHARRQAAPRHSRQLPAWHRIRVFAT
jgi:hypothetical protein